MRLPTSTIQFPITPKTYAIVRKWPFMADSYRHWSRYNYFRATSTYIGANMSPKLGVVLTEQEFCKIYGTQIIHTKAIR